MVSSDHLPFGRAQGLTYSSRQGRQAYCLDRYEYTLESFRRGDCQGDGIKLREANHCEYALAGLGASSDRLVPHVQPYCSM
jgi:hypothetical protein